MTDKKVKFRATLTWTYEADPQNYDKDDRDPESMAAVDQAQDDILAMVDMGLDSSAWEFSVKPVGEGE